MCLIGTDLNGTCSNDSGQNSGHRSDLPNGRRTQDGVETSHGGVADGRRSTQRVHVPAGVPPIVEFGLLDLELWFILQGDALSARLKGLAERYPARSHVPFARRQDNDDVACWDVSGNLRSVATVNDFASPGWEQRRELPGFYDWVRVAV